MEEDPTTTESSLQTPLLSADHDTTEEIISAEQRQGRRGADEQSADNNNAQNSSGQSLGEEEESRQIFASSFSSWWQYYLHCTLLPDNPWTHSNNESDTTSAVAENHAENDTNNVIDRNCNADTTMESPSSRGDGDDENDNVNSAISPVESNNIDNDEDGELDFDISLATIKFLKFLALTFAGIFGLHWMVSFRSGHRDVNLKVWQLWVFQGDLILRDTLVFFFVGRLWKPQRRGVDHLAWMLPVIFANVYFESQHYIPWLRHSATMFEMHCRWPWQLWLFVFLGILPVVSIVVVAHAGQAIQTRTIGIKVTELLVSAALFLGPVISSPSFHFHHWFAGWLIGMHCNFDVWWSSAVMAWCWGMYINGIAVYGRDPVLMCEYADYLVTDLKCPFDSCADASLPVANTTTSIDNWTGMLIPLLRDDIAPPPAVDWRNCSSNGYHP